MKVCFVIPKSYPLFNKRIKAYYGGFEVRSFLFAQKLAENNKFKVCFITGNYGQKRKEQYNKITVYYNPAWLNTKGTINKLWYLYNKFFKITGLLFHGYIQHEQYRLFKAQYRVYKNVNADVYCVFGTTTPAFELALFCKHFGKKYIFFAGHDDNFREEYQRNTKNQEFYVRKGYRFEFLIKNADVIITQTKHQQKLCNSIFNRVSFIIKNPISLESADHLKGNNHHVNYCLWIGRSDIQKQPEILLELAKEFNSVHFVMVMNKIDETIHRKIIDLKTKNVEILDYVPYKETDELFGNAVIFINTSISEGFANTFLQAGKHRVPILSLKIDPDEIISKNSCGMVAGNDFNTLKQHFKYLIENKNERMNMGNNLFDYVKANHDIALKVKELELILEKNFAE